MAKRLNITVDQEVFDYVERHGGANRSAFVNNILRQCGTPLNRMG
jgi:hypothetical protein